MTDAGKRAKSIGWVAVSTIAAGALGVVSNALIAARFGVGAATDAFFMAWSIPLIFGKFFQTGPLPQVVMPIFLETRAKQGGEAASRFASNVITASLIIFGSLSVLLWIAAPAVINLIAPGFSGDVRSLTIGMARLFVPVLFCMVMLSLLTGFLHAFRSFALPEWLARVPTLALIAVLLVGAAWGIEALAWSLVAGALIQLGLLWLAMRRVGVRYRPLVDWRQAELRLTLQRLSPFLVSAVFIQAQLIVHRLITSMQPLGTLSALSYGERITNFLAAMLSVIPTIWFPQFIDDALLNDRRMVRQRLARIVLAMTIVSLPIVVWLTVLSQPMIRLLFERGRFDAAASQQTALAISWLAIGLCSVGVGALLKTVAYAIQRPFIVNRTVIVTTLITMAVTLIAGRAWGLAGLAFAWGLIPYLISGGYLWQLRREIPAIGGVIYNGALGRVLAAGLGMAGICFGLHHGVFANWLAATSGWWARAAVVSAIALTGLAGYWALLSWLRIEERKEIVAMVWRAIGLKRWTAAPASAAVAQPVTNGVSLT